MDELYQIISLAESQTLHTDLHVTYSLLESFNHSWFRYVLGIQVPVNWLWFGCNSIQSVGSKERTFNQQQPKSKLHSITVTSFWTLYSLFEVSDKGHFVFRELTCDGIKTMADKNSYSQCLAPILVPCGPSFEFRSQFYTDHKGTSSNQNRSLDSTNVSLDFTFFCNFGKIPLEMVCDKF